MARAYFKEAFLRTLPVLAGYEVLGMGFGILCAENGYGFWWVFAMSLFIFAGSMQYMGVSLLTGGASLLSTALATLMVNARHLFYGVSMVERYKGAGAKKPYLIFALTDETYSLVCTGDAPEGMDFHTLSLVMSAMDQFYWVTGSLIGSVLGSLLNFNFAGIDFAMTALFVTVFVSQWLESRNHFSAVTGVGAAVVCLLIFGSGNFLIPSMLLITAILTLARHRLEATEKEGEDA